MSFWFICFGFIIWLKSAQKILIYHLDNNCFGLFTLNKSFIENTLPKGILTQVFSRYLYICGEKKGKEYNSICGIKRPFVNAEFAEDILALLVSSWSRSSIDRTAFLPVKNIIG